MGQPDSTYPSILSNFKAIFQGQKRSYFAKKWAWNLKSNGHISRLPPVRRGTTLLKILPASVPSLLSPCNFSNWTRKRNERIHHYSERPINFFSSLLFIFTFFLAMRKCPIVVMLSSSLHDSAHCFVHHANQMNRNAFLAIKFPEISILIRYHATEEQGRIHGNPVAHGQAGVVIEKCDGRRDGWTGKV